ncbi:hypothetical protein Fmac_030625 [Flemingia macrophylla]|uniref:Uncharacterized protein n=1 Tax=Flemingia macrophylla TaxID=520843 RepID=A0ABD1KZR6_9FABA
MNRVCEEQLAVGSIIDNEDRAARPTLPTSKCLVLIISMQGLLELDADIQAHGPLGPHILECKLGATHRPKPKPEPAHAYGNNIEDRTSNWRQNRSVWVWVVG